MLSVKFAPFLWQFHSNRGIKSIQLIFELVEIGVLLCLAPIVLRVYFS
jgi:hypothetical protein